MVHARRGSLAIIALLALAAPRATSAQEYDISQPASVAGGEPRSETRERSGALATSATEALPLTPRSDRKSRELTAPRTPGGTSTITTIAGGLGIVLGLFFLSAWLLRRNLPQGFTRLPGEVVEQLGRAPLSGKQNMHLVRVGGKLLLVVVTPFGAETLTEITHPDEVERLCGLCKQNAGHGASAEFREVLRHFERAPASGFLGETQRSDVELAQAGTRERGRRGGYDA